MYSEKELGFGVQKLRKFNMVLLEKWCWRLLVDNEGFWYKVMVAKYGEEEDSIRRVGRRRLGGVKIYVV